MFNSAFFLLVSPPGVFGDADRNYQVSDTSSPNVMHVDTETVMKISELLWLMFLCSNGSYQEMNIVQAGMSFITYFAVTSWQRCLLNILSVWGIHRLHRLSLLLSRLQQLLRALCDRTCMFKKTICSISHFLKVWPWPGGIIVWLWW